MRVEEQGVIICRGDGELCINPADGDVKWASPPNRWYGDHGYKSVFTLEGVLSLAPCYAPLPSCKECHLYEECRSFLEDEKVEPDPIECTAIDADATAASILGALKTISDVKREEILNLA